MKKLLVLGAVLLSSISAVSNASVVNVSASNGVFAGNSSTSLGNLTALNNAQIANNLGDSDQATYLFGSNSGGSVTNAELTMSFADTVFNQAGNDLAFYFVGDGVTANKNNSMQICFGASCSLGATVYNATLITGLGVDIGGTNVEWSVASFDLSDFGFAADAALGDFTIDIIAGGYNRLSDVSSLNASVSAVPVPAAVWLFASGLLTMLGVARRKA